MTSLFLDSFRFASSIRRWWYYSTLPRDRGVEELHGDLSVGPRSKVWTRGQ